MARPKTPISIEKAEKILYKWQVRDFSVDEIAAYFKHSHHTIRKILAGHQKTHRYCELCSTYKSDKRVTHPLTKNDWYRNKNGKLSNTCKHYDE